MKVPRHNAPRINPKLGTEVKHQARAQKIVVDPGQPSSKLTQAIVRFCYDFRSFYIYFIVINFRKVRRIGIRC